MLSSEKVEPVYVVYEKINNLINGMIDPSTGQLDERARNIKKEVFGDSSLIDADPLYFEISIMKSWGMTPQQWHRLSVYERSVILAREYCENMVSAVDRYYDYTRSQQDKMKKSK